MTDQCAIGCAIHIDSLCPIGVVTSHLRAHSGMLLGTSKSYLVSNRPLGHFCQTAARAAHVGGLNAATASPNTSKFAVRLSSYDTNLYSCPLFRIAAWSFLPAK
jgi:hypothetical protein